MDLIYIENHNKNIKYYFSKIKKLFSMNSDIKEKIKLKFALAFGEKYESSPDDSFLIIPLKIIFKTESLKNIILTFPEIKDENLDFFYAFIELILFVLSKNKNEKEELYNTIIKDIIEENILGKIKKLNDCDSSINIKNNNIDELFNAIMTYCENEEKKENTLLDYIQFMTYKISFILMDDSLLKMLIYTDIIVLSYSDKYDFKRDYKDNKMNLNNKICIDLITSLYKNNFKDEYILPISLVIILFDNIKDSVNNFGILSMSDIKNVLKIFQNELTNENFDKSIFIEECIIILLSEFEKLVISKKKEKNKRKRIKKKFKENEKRLNILSINTNSENIDNNNIDNNIISTYEENKIVKNGDNVNKDINNLINNIIQMSSENKEEITNILYQIKDRFDDLSKANDFLKNKIDILEKENAKKFKLLENANNDNKKIIEDSQKDNKDIKQRFEELQNANNDNKKIIEESQKENNDIKQRFAEIQKENNDIKQRFEESQKENKAMKQSLDEIKKENNEKSEAMEKIIKKQKDYELKIEKLEKKLDDFQNILVTIQFRDLAKNFLRFFKRYLTNNDWEKIENEESDMYDLILERFIEKYKKCKNQKAFNLIKNLIIKSADLLDTGNGYAHSIDIEDYKNEINYYKNNEIKNILSPLIFIFCVRLEIDEINESYILLKDYFRDDMLIKRYKITSFENYFNY